MSASDFMTGNAPRPADYAAPLVGMQLGNQIASLPGQYYSGKEKQAEIAMREAFPNGIPKNPDGTPNVGAIMDIGAKSGGAQWVQPLLQMMLYNQAGGDVAGGIGSINSGVPGGGGTPGAASAPPSAPTAALRQQPLSSAGADNQGDTTLRTTISELAGSRDVTPVISAIAREARINPDAPLTPAQVQQLTPMISQKLASLSKTTASDAGGPPFAPMLPRDGTSEPRPGSTAPIQPKVVPTQAIGPGGQPQGAPGQPQGAPGQPQGAPPPGPQPAQPPQQVAPPPQQVAQAPVPPRGSHRGTPLEGIVPDGTSPQAYLEALRRAAAGAREIAARVGRTNPKAADAALKQADDYNAREKGVVDAMAKAGELTTEQKNAAAAGAGNPLELKERETLGGEVNKAIGTDIAEYVKAARPAQQRIQILNTVGNALEAGKGNITTGPFADVVLKAKQGISSAFGVDLAGVPESEVAQKTGLQLATLAVKEISNRPTQFEFKVAMENNPGLLLSPKGSGFMIDIMKQSSRQQIELAKLAQKKENWGDWQNIVDKYYVDHPLISPFTGKPVGVKDVEELQKAAAPAPGAAPAKAAAPLQFNSPADLEKAIRDKKVQPGDVVKVPGGTVTIRQQ